MPGLKPTNEQLQERIETTIECIGLRLHKSQIKKVLRDKYGDMSGRTVEAYLSRAREQMHSNCRAHVAEHTNKALSFYESVLRNPKATMRDKLQAQERIDILLGLEAPKRTELTGAEGDPLIPATPEMDTALALVYGGSSRN